MWAYYLGSTHVSKGPWNLSPISYMLNLYQPPWKMILQMLSLNMIISYCFSSIPSGPSSHMTQDPTVLELTDLANKNIGYPIQFEFQIFFLVCPKCCMGHTKKNYTKNKQIKNYSLFIRNSNLTDVVYSTGNQCILVIDELILLCSTPHHQKNLYIRTSLKMIYSFILLALVIFFLNFLHEKILLGNLLQIEIPKAHPSWI